MKGRLITFVLVIASALLLGACGSPQWQEFSSAEGKFSVSMPGSPEKQSQSVSTAVGPIDLHMFTLDLGTSAYMVSFSDYPAEVITAAGPDAVLDGAAGGAISNVNGTVLNEREISISGYPGREIEVQIPKTAENDEGTAKARIYLVDARLYQVLVLGTKGKLSTEDADRFLNSFKLTSN